MAVQCHDLPQALHSCLCRDECRINNHLLLKESEESLMSISAWPKQWNKKHAPLSRTFRNEWIQSWNYKNRKWVNNSQHVASSVTQLRKKTFLERGTMPKSVAIQRKNLFYHFRLCKQTQCTELEHAQTSWNNYVHLEVTQEVGSSRCSSNFGQHMPGQNLCSDTDYPQKDFTCYSSVPPAKCQGSAIN